MIATLARRALPLLVAVPPLAAQAWRPGHDVALVVEAVAARTARDTDTLLAGWQAVAEGMVRYAVAVGHDAGSVERVIRADQLRVEVYGEAPNRSKQAIVAWRATTYAPNDIVYHRDHLGIVAHDFGPRIRLGEGDEVRDVPHPLSAPGLAHYEFAVADTVRVSGPDAEVRVVAVHVRPRDPEAPGTIGTLFLDVERAATVRFHFTFTASSYRDPTVEAIVVTLENAFLDGRRWLPWRQSITIRREGPLLALPLVTLLRADWTIGDYALGVAHAPLRFRGMLVDGLRAPNDSGWSGRVEDALATMPDPGRSLGAILQHADALAPEARLSGMPRLRFLGDRGLGSLLSVNRVQGVTPGAGIRIAIDDAHRLDLSLGYGTADRRLTRSAALERDEGDLTLSLAAGHDVIDAGGASFGSILANSMATAIAGSDGGSWVLRDHFVATEVRGGGTALRWSLAAVRERTASLETRFTAIDGTRRENPALGAGSVVRVVARVGSRRVPERGGWLLEAERGTGDATWGRVALEAGRRVGTFAWRVGGGLGSAGLPGYRSFMVGGRGTLVGVPHRSIGGRRLLRAEVAVPIRLGIPAPGLGRWGSDLLASQLTPYLAGAVAGGELPGLPWRPSDGVEPVAGVRLDLWGPLLRLEVGWALRRGTVGLTLDAHPDWWPLL